MFRRTKALLAIAAVTAAVAPAAHAEDTGGGFGCGFTSTNDPTGQINQDPNAQTGEIDGGPIVIANTTSVFIDDVTIQCTLVRVKRTTPPTTSQPNPPNCTPYDEYPKCYSRSSTVPGNVGVLADSINYFAKAGPEGDDVYLCTYVSWNGDKGHTDWYWDADEDDPATGYVGEPGNQCSLATSVESPEE